MRRLYDFSLFHNTKKRHIIPLMYKHQRTDLALFYFRFSEESEENTLVVYVSHLAILL